MAIPEPTRSPEIQNDPIRSRWVIIPSARTKLPWALRPSLSKPNLQKILTVNYSSSRPFCIGDEHDLMQQSRAPNWPKWRFEQRSGRVGSGHNRVRVHYVVIETPVQSVQWSDLDPSKIADILPAYKTKNEQIKGFDSINMFRCSGTMELQLGLQ
ncbi:hypothetical protein DITRI_Ditri06bG0157400 [Diplodiscus trichospermus]